MISHFNIFKEVFAYEDVDHILLGMHTDHVLLHITFLAEFFLTDITFKRFMTAVKHYVYFYVGRFFEYFTAANCKAFVLGIVFKCFVVVLTGYSIQGSWYPNECSVLIAYIPVKLLLIYNVLVVFLVIFFIF